MSRQQCPSCGKHWTPPGPCSNYDPEVAGPCEYVEPERVHSVVPAPARAPIPADNHSYGRTVDPKTALAQVRAELEEAKRRKGAA